MHGRAVCLTIGNFDGVHRGHRTLIERACSQPDQTPVLMTFDPHPAQFFAPDKRLPRLMDRWLQAQIAVSLGISRVWVQRFDENFAALSAMAFLDEVLGRVLSVKRVVVGHDFRFGAGRSGDLGLLRSWATANRVALEVVDAVEVGGEPVSSSRIRGALSSRDLALARDLLGGPIYVQGLVTRGDGRGRKIGFPTANVDVAADSALPSGVFAVRVFTVDDDLSSRRELGRGVANYGLAPTFRDSALRRLEVHLISETKVQESLDLYGKRLLVEFIDWIRAERKFASVEELILQIEDDRRRACDILRR